MQAPQKFREVLELIVCPVCFGPLSFQEFTPPATIGCSSCGRRYPVQDGIPILLESRATR